MKASTLARLNKLELNAPKARNVITCLPLPKQSMANHCETLGDGIYRDIHGYGKSIYYADRPSLDAYLKTQSHDKALIYSILTPEDCEAIKSDVLKNM